jgi:hypothetical protein
VLAGFVCAQADHPRLAIGRNVNPSEVVKALEKLKEGKANAYHAQVVAEAGATEAIPDLERQFARVSDPLDKAKFAQVVLLLGDR